MAGLVVVAVAGVLATGDRALGALAGWGGLLTGLGALLARSGDFGSGTETAVLGLGLVALGVAIIVGAALDTGMRRRTWGGVAVTGARAALIAAAVIVGSTMLLAGPGRAGLPADTLGESFRFAVDADGTPTRILLFGSTDALPGESRTLDGLGYRIIVPPYPTTWEAYLNEPRLGDDALAELLTGMLDGEVRRAGSALAEFGIAWVAFVEPSPLELLFEAQLDLVPLRSLDFPVFRNEVAAAPAVSADGVAWLASGTGYQAPPGAGGAVTVASNADDRWGPGVWQQDGWANRIDGGASVGFSGHMPRRLMGVASAAWALMLVATWLGSRRWGAKR